MKLGGFAIRSTCQASRGAARWAAGLHRDQRGTISIASVFALIMLTMLLGMVMNSVRQVNEKVQMQNAADAATYAGGVVITRNMNTMAFTNHLLSDVFALTAFLRESYYRNAESFTPETLDHWDRIAPHLAKAPYQPFAELGIAIPGKTELEGDRDLEASAGDMVSTWGDWHYAVAEPILPVMEAILVEEMIPNFQTALAENSGYLAQAATDEIARRHGESWPQDAELRGVLWTNSGVPVVESEYWILPVSHPLESDIHFTRARDQRQELAREYLSRWNDDNGGRGDSNDHQKKLMRFDRHGRMSQFGNLWRIFTRGYLKKLLEEEYPDTNLPFQIHETPYDMGDVNTAVEFDYMFVGVVYQEGMNEAMTSVFKTPIETNRQAYAQIYVFIPRRRIIFHENIHVTVDRGGLTRQDWHESRGWVEMPPDSGNWVEVRNWRTVGLNREWYPDRWNLLSQNWTMQLTPATSSALPEILSTAPDIDGFEVQAPDYSGLSVEDIYWLSNH